MSARARHRWSLQTRLIVTVVSFVALILVGVGFATGTILRSIMAENLNAQVSEASNIVQRMIQPGSTAVDVLNAGRQENGTLLVLQTFSGLSGAYVDHDGNVIGQAIVGPRIYSDTPRIDLHVDPDARVIGA